MKKIKSKPLYCIANDGDFAVDYVGCDNCVVAYNIPTLRKARRILKKDLFVRFAEYDKDGFYIYEDYETVDDRLADGETIKHIFKTTKPAMVY
jgi:hypothetical protein